MSNSAKKNYPGEFKQSSAKLAVESEQPISQTDKSCCFSKFVQSD